MTDGARIGQELGIFLRAHAPADVARVLSAIAEASVPVSQLIRRGALAGTLGAVVGTAHDGHNRKAQDLFADDAFIAGLKGTGVRAVLSEEHAAPVPVDAEGTLLAAFDPLDGAANIDVDVSVGTVFSILDAPAAGPVSSGHFLQAGVKQRAAGFLVYGPFTVFVFSTGDGAHIATLDPEVGAFRITASNVSIPADSSEFAINASNSRHWPEPVRAYVEDCIEGAEGPRGKDFNMRWVGSMAADVYRILVRGGVYLYPQDSREGYEHGRLRLLYEANPIAFVVEQAGGAAIDGFERVLEIAPKDAHERTPFIFGSREKVERIKHYYHDTGPGAARSPLFGRRGLLRR